MPACLNRLWKRIYTYLRFELKKGDIMKYPMVITIMFVFAAILGIGLLGGGGLTGNASGASAVLGNSVVLSVGAALLAIGVLIVDGLQSSR